MQHFDVFNGDADGLCALQQLRLAEPRDSILVTGPKREIDLLGRVPSGAAGSVTVLDVSMEKNRAALDRLLAEGVSVTYFDHHFPGEIPSHSALSTHIETLSDKGTSLLVDDYLAGRHRAWAVVGTFGDNFDRAARRAAEPLALGAEAIEQLRQLGILLNYNGYGAKVEDLHYAPDDLFCRLRPYADPLDFVAEDAAFRALLDGYQSDMAEVGSLRPAVEDDAHRLFILPAEPWARRASGVFANDLAQQEPGRAHAILTRLADASFLVSVRAPIARPTGADDLCRQFATGGGRKAAAGINRLPEADYDRFVDAFQAAFRP